MLDNGIGVNVHYIPIHLQPFYQRLGFKSGDFPEAEIYYSRAITIPLFHGMTFSEQDKVVNVLESALQTETFFKTLSESNDTNWQ